MTKFVGILFPDEVKVDEASQVLRDLDAEARFCCLVLLWW